MTNPWVFSGLFCLYVVPDGEIVGEGVLLGLPNFELTGDFRWDKDGDLHAAYDLHLDGDAGDHAFHQDEDTVSGQDIIIDDQDAIENDKPAVKVLSEKSHSEVLKMVDDFRKNQPAIDPNSAVSINLSNEFAEILTLDRSGIVN